MLGIKLKDITKGDTFVYEIVDNREFKGRYLILWETGFQDERFTNCHIMKLKITKDHSLPQNEEEFLRLEDVISRQMTIKSIEDEIKEKNKDEVETDEYGLVHTYRLRIYGFRNLSKYLIYLGNYNINWDMKPKEYWSPNPKNISRAVYSTKEPFKFEDNCLLYYEYHNLRRSYFYQQLEEEKYYQGQISNEQSQENENKFTVLELLRKIKDNDSDMPKTIKVNNIVYRFDTKTRSYLCKENGIYKEVANDLSAFRPSPKDWLLLELEIVNDEEYQEK